MFGALLLRLNLFEYLKENKVLLFERRIFGGQGLMRIVRGMHKLIHVQQRELGCYCDNSFSQGIGVTAPKARKRDKLKTKAFMFL